jgi:hypothetical protein
LGGSVTELVRKLHQALPERYHQVAISIETLLDLSTMSTEELMGRLKSTEQRLNLGGGSDSVAKLNLSEDELVTHVAAKMNVSGGGSSGKSRGSSSSHTAGAAADAVAVVVAVDLGHPGPVVKAVPTGTVGTAAMAGRSSLMTNAGTAGRRATGPVNARRRSGTQRPRQPIQPKWRRKSTRFWWPRRRSTLHPHHFVPSRGGPHR